MLPTADEIVLSGLVATRMKDLKIDDEDWCWVEGRIWFTDERDLLLYSLKYSRDDIMYNMINDMVDSLSN